MLINEVAKRLGISQDAIRYYEKAGIIAPRHNEKNGYREYEPFDLFCLMRCMRYRKIGLSIDEIVQITHEPSSACLLNSIVDQIQEIDNQISRENLLRKFLKRYEQKIRTRVHNVGRMWVTWRPEMRYIFSLYRNKNEFQTNDMNATRSDWIQYMPFSETIGFTPVDDVLNPDVADTENWGLAIEEKYLRPLNIPVNDSVLHLPEEMVMATVYDAKEEGYIRKDVMKDILSRISAAGYSPYGVITSNLLIHSWNKDQHRCIFEIMVPIRSEELF